MANNIVNNRKALDFLDLDAKPQAKAISKTSSIEHQINQGMQEACHEYLLKNWKKYYHMISTDATFGIDTHKSDGTLKHTKDNTATPITSEYRVVIETDNGTTVKGKKVGKCFRLGFQQTYLKGVNTRACCYYTVDGKTTFFDDKGDKVTTK